MNYFKVLNLTQKYDIEPALLKENYLAEQMKYHPDRAPSNELKIKYIETSMLLNEAYKILGDDYLRAEYLLKLNGFDLSDEKLNYKLSHLELEQIIDEYDMLEKIDQIEDLKKIEQQKLDAKSALIVLLSKEFKSHNFAKALEIAVRLKYLTNLAQNIKLKIKHANNRD